MTIRFAGPAARRRPDAPAISRPAPPPARRRNALPGVALVLVLALAPLAGRQGAGQASGVTGREPLGDARAAAAGRERMRADIEFLSAPPLEGRASLTRGADVAALFIATEMAKAGLLPPDGRSYEQRFDLFPVRLDRGRSSVRVAAPSGERVFAPASVFFPDPARPVDLDVPVVFAGFGITAPEIGYDDYAGVDVKDKAVLIFDHEPQESDPASPFLGTGFTLHANAWTKTWNAQRHGAAAVLVVTEPINHHRVVAPAPGRANAPAQALAPSELRIPRVSVPPEAAAALLDATGRTAAQFQADIDRTLRPVSRELPGVRVTLNAVNSLATSDPGASCNVVGLLPGADPSLEKETVLVTAHYDHLGVQNGTLYPGANDNASGVAGLLETARRLRDARPARSVLFVAFGSEEQLMLGSYYYVAHPVRPLETTRAVLNLDMIGRDEEHTPESEGEYAITAGRSDQLNLVGAAFSPDLAAVLLRAARPAGLALSDKFDRDSSMRALFRCDHLPFLQKGIPAIWLFGGFHPGYHEPLDTVDRLDFDKMTRVVSLTAEAVRGLAAPTPPPRFVAAGTKAR